MSNLDLLKKILKQAHCQLWGEAYSQLRDIGSKFYREDVGLSMGYRMLISEITHFEKFYLPNDPIIEIPAYDFDKKISLPRDYKDHEVILNFLVDRTRRMLRYCGSECDNLFGLEENSNNTRAQSFEEMDLADKCYKSAWYVYDVATHFDIDAKVITMEPGFILCSPLYERTGGHCYTIVFLDDREYLVDCTYSQFFLKKRCMPEKIGNMLSPGCAPGFFMTMTPSRRRVADKILKDGWILLTDEVLKDYLDGFVLSDRNGLYYEATGDFSATTPYSAADYKKMLRADTDILDYEPRETLGYQYRPLKNTKMKINFQAKQK